MELISITKVDTSFPKHSALLHCLLVLGFFGVFLIMKSEVIEITKLTLAVHPSPENQSFVVTVVGQDLCVTQKVTPE